MRAQGTHFLNHMVKLQPSMNMYCRAGLRTWVSILVDLCEAGSRSEKTPSSSKSDALKAPILVQSLRYHHSVPTAPVLVPSSGPDDTIFGSTRSFVAGGSCPPAERKLARLSTGDGISNELPENQFEQASYTRSGGFESARRDEVRSRS